MIRMFFRYGGWIPLVCLPIVVAALFVWYAGGQQARALARDGIVVEARVALLQLVEGNPMASNTALRSDRYTVTVAYDAGGGQMLTETRNVSAEFFATLSPQQSLPIRVLPDDPTVIEVEPGWVEGNVQAAGWVGLAFLVLGALPLPLILRKAAGAVRIRKAGIPRQGEVVEIISIRGKGQAHHLMRFRWTGGDGAPHEGRSRLRGRDYFAAHPVGSAVTLHEDPANPAQAIWERDLT